MFAHLSTRNLLYRIGLSVTCLAGFVAILLTPMLVQAHTAGNCKHQHAVVRSLCDPGTVRKKCTIDGKKGRCAQSGLTCFCKKRKTSQAELTVNDLRGAFDAALVDLQPPGAICPQVTGPLNTVLVTAPPVLDDFAAEPQFIDSAFLATLDTLLRDLPVVEAVFVQCLQAFPADLEPALRNTKAGLLPAIDELFDIE